MRQRRLTATVALLLVLAGCGGGGDDPGTPRVLDFSILDINSGEIRSPRVLAIKTDAEWQSFWAEYTGGMKAAPAVNFESRTVVGVFSGEKPIACYTTEIRRVTQDASGVRLEYAESLPAGVANGTVGCGQAIIYPGMLATIPRSDLPVSFQKVDR